MTVSDQFIDRVRARLAQERPVRYPLPEFGRVHIERQLPFLCVYRHPVRHVDTGMENLLIGEASYLFASARNKLQPGISLLVADIAKTIGRHTGAFLIVEIWSARSTPESEPDNGRLGRPTFRICAPKHEFSTELLTRFEDAFGKVSLNKQPSDVEIAPVVRLAPPGMTPLISALAARQLGVSYLGIEVGPIFRDKVSGEVDPSMLRALQRGFSRALKRSIFAYVRSRTRFSAPHYYALGKRALVRAVWTCDSQLAAINDSFDFLYSLTPINTNAAWESFRKTHYDHPPEFVYRPCPVDASVLKRALYAVPLEHIEDPVVSELFREKQAELDREITMIADRGTRNFVYESQQVYGALDRVTIATAKKILRRIPPTPQENGKRDFVSSEEFVERARLEIERYRQHHNAFSATAAISDDLPGLLVSRGRLLVGKSAKIPRARVEALINHEVGTHLVTYYNGRVQPFKLFYAGLAGYDELQEGIAVLSEYLSGGLSGQRLRTLAARVLGVERMLDGATFIETFRFLADEHQFAAKIAFTVTMRIYRGGGLTKDAIYLKGLIQLMKFLRNGGSLEPLFVGKIGASHVGFVKELQWRHVLRPAPLTPRYLTAPGSGDRLQKARAGMSILDMVQSEKDSK